jgi:hypothetical protein
MELQHPEQANYNDANTTQPIIYRFFSQLPPSSFCPDRGRWQQHDSSMHAKRPVGEWRYNLQVTFVTTESIDQQSESDDEVVSCFIK